MARLVRALVFGLAFSGLAVENEPVRRANRKRSPSNMHCVVWGDGPYFGKKFDNEKDAGQYFQRVKRHELVAIHYDKRDREVQRFKSPRVKTVTWHRLADWCKEDHATEASLEAGPKLGIRVGVQGTLSEEPMEQQSMKASLLAADPTSPDKGLTASDFATLKARTSSKLIGKVTVIEEKLAQLVPRAKDAFESLGINNYVGALSFGGSDKRTLKTRVTAVDNFIAGLVDNVQSLEEELLGSPAVTSSSSTMPQTQSSSLKAKVDSMDGKVDNLKKRLFALDASDVVGKLPKLEERMVFCSSKILAMFKNVGYPDGAAQAFTPNPTETFKHRMASLGRAVAAAQRSTKTLGYEMLEHSWETVTMPTVKGTKAEMQALANFVDDLQQRVSELESGPFNGIVAKAEKSLSQLQAKAVELSKRIGLEAPSSMLETYAPNTAFKGRIQHLEKLASSVESKFASLENELLGGARASSNNLTNTQSIKGRAMNLDVKIDSLTSRAAALEQEM